MKASLDTDIAIHLYSSGKQGLMFTFFDKLYMHTYLYEKELARRFSHKLGTKRDYNWVCEFCSQQETDYKVKMRGLKEYLSKI